MTTTINTGIAIDINVRRVLVASLFGFTVLISLLLPVIVSAQDRPKRPVPEVPVKMDIQAVQELLKAEPGLNGMATERSCQRWEFRWMLQLYLRTTASQVEGVEVELDTAKGGEGEWVPLWLVQYGTGDEVYEIYTENLLGLWPEK